MTDKEILTASNYVRCEDVITALITIKRGIYSKPIKTYIDSLIKRLKPDICLRASGELVQEHCYKSAMSYHLVQESFTYGQNNPHSVDVNV